MTAYVCVFGCGGSAWFITMILLGAVCLCSIENTFEPSSKHDLMQTNRHRVKPKIASQSASWPQCTQWLDQLIYWDELSWPLSLQLQFDYDMMIPRCIRLWRKWSKLQFAFDSTAIRLRLDCNEKLMCSFFAHVEWKQARTIHCSQIVVIL